MAGSKTTARLLLFVAGGIVAGSLVVAVAGAQQRVQPGTHVVVKRAQPSCAESIRELGRQGEQVHCSQTNARATGEAPARHGPYRIVPAGYVGELAAKELELPATLGERTNDLAKLRSSSLFAEPTYLPAGYQLANGDTFDATSELVVHLQYRGPKGPLDVFRTRQTKEVFDVYAPPASGDVELQQTTLKGTPALVFAPKPGTIAERANAVTVVFFKNGVNTTVKTHGLGVQETLKVAESIP